jgi:hypothetical protein
MYDASVQPAAYGFTGVGDRSYGHLVYAGAY